MAEIDELDRVEDRIDIDAPADRVWDLVSRPGWWINEGEVEPDTEVRREGELDVVNHAKWGEFRFRTVELDRPRYAAFRWHASPGGPFPEDASTLVEFWVEDRAGGVTLKVRESGFSTLGDDRSAWLKHREGNVEGWRSELGAGKRYVEGSVRG